VQSIVSSVTALLVVEEAVRTAPATTGRMREFNRKHLGELSFEAKRRLRWFDWHHANGENVSRTCRHFSIARQTFYRWLKRYNPYDLTTLEDRSSRARHCRQKTWTPAEILAVCKIRERFPAWGKVKLAKLLLKAGLKLSASRVGRILSYLKRTRQLKEPLRRTSVNRRQWKRDYAIRKPKDYTVKAPGDLVQIDTVEIRPEPGIILKQFTTVDMISRWSVPTIAYRATAMSAARALDALIARTPFPIKAIQVDGGSEFMAEFEAACKERGIRLFELPPRSPKLNGRVERANRTYKEEFYNCSNATPTVAGVRPHLRRWEDIYNTIRPHQALHYLTPAEFLADWNAAHRSEEVSRTS
jgi:putative transposase